MTAAMINGREIASNLTDDLKVQISKLSAPPGLSVILVGDDPASQLYVSSKQKMCATIGITSHVYRLGATATSSELNTLIDTLNDNDMVHGILLQLPLPKHLEPALFLERIKPHKDVDGLHPANLGLLMSGRPRFIPCTPQGVMHLIHTIEPHIAGMHAVVVGRSVLVGKPVAQLLLNAHATVTQTHAQTRDLANITCQADILVVAAGNPQLITRDHVKPGAIVIDVGMTRVDQKLHGDVVFDDVVDIVRAITPVPGGVGPMTIAYLLKNTVDAALQGAL